MKYLLKYEVFESIDSINKKVNNFKTKWGIELDKNFTDKEIDIISSGLSYYDTDFIRNKIDRIIRKDMGSVRGRWKNTKKKKWMYINPKVFDYKKTWSNKQVNIPHCLFTVIHEVAHCVDYLERVSFSKEWRDICGWKKCDIDDKIPEGYHRYIEKRPGRSINGHKKSNWVYKETTGFCRKYSKKNPKEDFADSLAFTILGLSEKLKGEIGEKKLKIIRKLLKKVD